MLEKIKFKENIQQLTGQKRFQFEPVLIPDWFGKAAVLILFWEEAGTIKVVLTERSSKLKNHSGEVSFPGGRMEEGESYEQTALREADEEIGIDPLKVNIIGRLDDAWSRAAYHLRSIVGWYDGIPDFTANTDEVEKILAPNLDELLDENHREEKIVERQGIVFKNLVIKYQDSVIFGLTADLLSEALDQGMGNNSERGKRRAETLQGALDSQFFAYQKSNGNLPPQSDTV
jgi:8-oxo-dGTP pyrophosphatase MutT (NUDIX family)